MEQQHQQHQHELLSVLSFLTREGFAQAAQALLAQLSQGQGTSPAAGELWSSAEAAAASGAASGLHLALPPPPPTSESQAGKSSSSRRLRAVREQHAPWAATVDEYDNQDDAGYSRRDVQGQQHFVDMELDLPAEEDPDELQSVASLSQPSASPMNALDDDEDDDDDDGDGEEEEDGGSPGRDPGDGYGRGGGGGSDSSPCASSISGAVIDLAPSTTSRNASVLQPPTSPRGGSGGGVVLSAGGSASGGAPPLPSLFLGGGSGGDEAWDLGPVGIRLADPVVTPPARSNSHTALNEGDGRPVLSRVESLASSFKDFEAEAAADDGEGDAAPSGPASPSRPAAPGKAGEEEEEEAVPGEIEFHPLPQGGDAGGLGRVSGGGGGAGDAVDLVLSPPLGLAAAEPPEPDLSGLVPLAPPAGAGSAPPAAAAAAAAAAVVVLAPAVAPVGGVFSRSSSVGGQGKGGGGGGSLPGTSSAGAAAQPLGAPGSSGGAVAVPRGHRARGGKKGAAGSSGTGGGGGGGGFSFPVASPPSEPPTDHRLFKSWPSVRSSCTSEMVGGASDDDHAAADYADDEYLRSKPTSRTTSQNLGDALASTGGGAAALAPQPSEGGGAAAPQSPKQPQQPQGGLKQAIAHAATAAAAAARVSAGGSGEPAGGAAADAAEGWSFAPQRPPSGSGARAPALPSTSSGGGAAAAALGSPTAAGGGTAPMLILGASPSGKGGGGGGGSGQLRLDASTTGGGGAGAGGGGGAGGGAGATSTSCISEPSTTPTASGSYNTCLPPGLIALVTSHSQQLGGSGGGGGRAGGEAAEGALSSPSPAASSRQPTPPALGAGGDSPRSPVFGRLSGTPAATSTGSRGKSAGANRASGGGGGGGGGSGSKPLTAHFAPLPPPAGGSAARGSDSGARGGGPPAASAASASALAVGRAAKLATSKSAGGSLSKSAGGGLGGADGGGGGVAGRASAGPAAGASAPSGLLVSAASRASGLSAMYSASSQPQGAGGGSTARARGDVGSELDEEFHEALSGTGDVARAEELELTEDVSVYGEDDGDGDDEQEDEENEDVAVLAAAQALGWQSLEFVPGGASAASSSYPYHAQGPLGHPPHPSSSPPSGSNLASAEQQQALQPRYTINEDGTVVYEYDPEYISRKYEVLTLRVYHRRHRTGFEEAKDFPIRMNDLIAGRYQVVDFLGSAAFSRAVQALDVKTNMLVCLKIIKNNKDYLDQSLDEIKLLQYVNSHDPQDKYGVVRLHDFFYYKEHLFLVCELLRANLYEFQKYNRESGDAPYFTNARIQRIAYQVLRSLSFLHALGLIHSDLKPENILIKSYSKCEVKVIDLGSSCFVTDQLSSYVQSRSYRAPEVILGLPYDQKVDVWSLGCILAELSSGQVLFQNDSLATLLARLEGILGPVPRWMVRKGRYANRYYTRSGQLYEKNAATERYELLSPKRTSLRHRVPDADEGLLSFIAHLLHVDPRQRPTAMQALQHPWLQMAYPAEALL